MCRSVTKYKSLFTALCRTLVELSTSLLIFPLPISNWTNDFLVMSCIKEEQIWVFKTTEGGRPEKKRSRGRNFSTFFP